jgi:hypothetical protein
MQKHVILVNAKDIDEAARIACAEVLGHPKDTVKVLSIYRVPPRLPGPST